MKAVQRLERTILGQELIIQWLSHPHPHPVPINRTKGESLGLSESVPLWNTPVSQPCVRQSAIQGLLGPLDTITNVDGKDQLQCPQ